MRFSISSALLVLLLGSVCAFASEKPRQLYVSGIFERALQAQPGCGDISTVPQAVLADLSPCAGHFDTVYKVRSGDAVYILAPKGNLEKKNCGLLVRSTIPDSVLSGKPPLTPIEVRSDGRHFFVKVGNRESEYAAVRIQ